MSVLTRRTVTRRPVEAMAGGDFRSEPTAKPPRTFDPQLQLLIGERLRAYYSDLLSGPVPDRFLDLLKGFDSPRPEGR